MKKSKKSDKRLIIFPIFCLFLAIFIVLVHVFSLPKKALGQILNHFEKTKSVNETIKTEDGQERFNIAAYNNNPEYIPLGDDQFEGMGPKDPYRGNGIDISSYINDDNNIMINADYQNLIQIPAPGEPSIIFDKGVKVSDGDVYAAKFHGFIFQGHTLEWSMPIRGNHILYYR